MVKSNYDMQVSVLWEHLLKNRPCYLLVKPKFLSFLWGEEKETFGLKDFTKISLWNADSPSYCFSA